MSGRCSGKDEQTKVTKMLTIAMIHPRQYICSLVHSLCMGFIRYSDGLNKCRYTAIHPFTLYGLLEKKVQALFHDESASNASRKPNKVSEIEHSIVNPLNLGTEKE